jgi:hypothetical protein
MAPLAPDKSSCSRESRLRHANVEVAAVFDEDVAVSAGVQCSGGVTTGQAEGPRIGRSIGYRGVAFVEPKDASLRPDLALKPGERRVRPGISGPKIGGEAPGWQDARRAHTRCGM